MKKSTQILGLPIISITEGRELGMSKSLLIDAAKRAVAAITIEDDDWYRGVKLLPYDNVIAVGEDAVTITNSDTILTLENASDFENLLDENIRIIGTKAITKAGTIQGKVTEIFVGDDGKVEQCEVTAPDGSTEEVPADKISIFGKQVTVIDVPNMASNAKKNLTVQGDALSATENLPADEAESDVAEVSAFPEENPIHTKGTAIEEEADRIAKEKEAAAVKIAKPEVKAPAPAPKVTANAKPAPAPTPKPTPAPAPAPKVAPKATPAPAANANNAAAIAAQALKSTQSPAVAQAMRAAQTNAAKPAPKAAAPTSDATQKAADDRHRRFLLGKKATRRIATDTGVVIVEAGSEITEEVLQKAKLANKIIELSMNVQ